MELWSWLIDERETAEILRRTKSESGAVSKMLRRLSKHGKQAWCCVVVDFETHVDC